MDEGVTNRRELQMEGAEAEVAVGVVYLLPQLFLKPRLQIRQPLLVGVVAPRHECTNIAEMCANQHYLNVVVFRRRVHAFVDPYDV